MTRAVPAFRSTLAAAAVMSCLAATACSRGRSGQTSAGDVAQAATPTPACDARSNDAAAALCESRAFLASLSEEQRAQIVLPMTAQNAAMWSNLPYPLAKRNGIWLKDLTDSQRAAAFRLAKVALSNAGFATFQSLRLADSVLAKAFADRTPRAGGPPAGGAPGGGGMPQLQFGENYYILAFLGTPSDTGRWMLQIGGHHFGANLTYRGGSRVEGSTPYFVGVEPQRFTIGGVTYMPLQPRKVATYAMINSLDASQRKAAQLSSTFDDVVVGPGKDGKFPTSEGLSGGALTAQQRTLVRDAIASWVKDVPDATSRALLADYVTDDALKATRVAWATSTDTTARGSYVRIDGPRVWIEFVCQGGVIFRDQIHFHTIWRDKKTDYGASFSQ